MSFTINIRKGLVVIPFILFSIAIIITQAEFFHHQGSILPQALLLDLLVTIPLIYFLIIRSTTIPKTTILPIIVLGFIIANLTFPGTYQNDIALIKSWFIPFMEGAILIYVAIKVRKAVGSFKQARMLTFDFFSIAKKACKEIMPAPIANLMATEIAVFYYAIFKWKRDKQHSKTFTYHKNTGTQQLLIVFLFLIVIETFALHLLLMQWNVVIAWVLSGLSIYTFFQVLGICKSMTHRPMEITKDGVHVKYGILKEAMIPFELIDRVENASSEQVDAIALSSYKDLEGHNIILFLKEEHVIDGFYGFKKKFKTLCLHLDEPKLFEETIIQHI